METVNRKYAGKTTALATVTWFVGEDPDEASASSKQSPPL